MFLQNSKPGALVLTNSYTGLGIIRSLGRQGIPVWVIGDKFTIASVSRYARRTIPLEGKTESEHVEFLLNIAKQFNLYNWSLFPDSDKGALFIAKNHELLRRSFRLTIQSWETLKWAIDKRLTYKLAYDLKINHPKTYYPRSRKDVEAIEGLYPMVLKPAHHQGKDRFSVISGAWRANDHDELLAYYDEANESVADPTIIMIQEMIPGGGEVHFSYGALCKNGDILADASVQKTRLLPVDFGASATTISINLPEIETASRRWLKRINFTGLVSVDYKYDSRDGLYKMLDVNARAWGWLPLCRRAGVDFPYLMWNMIYDEPVYPIHAKSGYRWIRTPYDMMSALQLINRGSLTLKDYILSLKGAEHEMYAIDDLLPAIVEIPLLFNLLVNKLRGK